MRTPLVKRKKLSRVHKKLCSGGMRENKKKVVDSNQYACPNRPSQSRPPAPAGRGCGLLGRLPHAVGARFPCRPLNRHARNTQSMIKMPRNQTRKARTRYLFSAGSLKRAFQGFTSSAFGVSTTLSFFFLFLLIMNFPGGLFIGRSADSLELRSP